MKIQEIHHRTISFADPDYEPGAVEREAAARAGADKARAKANEIAHRIASKLGGTAKDVTQRGIDSPTYTYIEGIEFETRSGKKIKSRVAYDSFGQSMALYFSPAFVPHNKESIAILRHIADDHHKKLYAMDFHGGKTIDWINIGYYNEHSEDLIKALINAVKKFDA